MQMEKQLRGTTPNLIKLQAIILSFILFVGLFTSNAWPCADRKYLEIIPRKDVDAYENIAVVKVIIVETTGDGGIYAHPFHMRGVIVKTLKGNLTKGDELTADTKGKNPGAACPIDLLPGKTYLLFLKGSKGLYELPRYGTLFMDDSHPLFNSYIKQIEDLLSK